MNANDLRHVCQNLFAGQTEAVTLKSRQTGAAASFLSWTVGNARQRRLKRTEREALATLCPTAEKAIELYKAELDGATPVSPATGAAPTPKRRDVITTADGLDWEVGDMEIALMGNNHILYVMRSPGT